MRVSRHCKLLPCCEETKDFTQDSIIGITQGEDICLWVCFVLDLKSAKEAIKEGCMLESVGFLAGDALCLALLAQEMLVLVQDALEPYMSQRTLEIHWGKHHRGYLEGLNKQLENNNSLYGYTMDELVKVTYNNGNPLPEFNNAAQVWNHDFFWESMQPGGGKIPGHGVLLQIEKDFGSFTNFREKFIEAALTLFGSGWIWLALKTKEKRLAVIKTSNGVTPIVWGDIPIISLDMWEHAYYLDYKNDKVKYVNMFLNNLVSWNAATARMARAEAFVNLGEPKIPVA
ncbi:hypothetical protein HHK36_024131 [Tetracentron sinense]|uniref:superoxide dismutase n=1 Tax=Tetracentron sinense TaxID=13715 RepID=A0A835D6E7_TETSI|nr:hypothetical protein HHK36_024131 [Tetracentron sinense]